MRICNYKYNAFLIKYSTLNPMYTSIEKAQNYTPAFPDATKAKRKMAEKAHKLLTAVLGREFMELSLRHKVYGLYACLSFMALCAWDDQRIWPNLLNLLNFANAVRLANQVAQESSARD